jgi:hypothetical protein
MFGKGQLLGKTFLSEGKSTSVSSECRKVATHSFWNHYLEQIVNAQSKDREKTMRTTIFALVLAMPMMANCQTAIPSAGQNQHHEASDPHSSDVDTRGDHAMGFSHETSTHHFRLLSDGGAIEGFSS